MKRILIFMTALALLFIGCTKEDVSLSEEQIEFFNVMGEKIPYMKPDTTVDVASTNEFTITNKDIMQNVYQGLRGDVQVLDNADQAQIEGYLKQIINIKAQQELLLAEAAKENLSVSEDSIDVFIEKNFYEPNGGKKAFLEQLKIQGIDMDFVRQDTKNNILLLKYIEEVALDGKDFSVTDDEVAQNYQDNIDTYKQETATVRHILFLTQDKSDSEKKEIRTMAEAVLDKALAGNNFSELAEQYSEDPGSKDKGGLYENFTKGRMVQAFEDASFNNEPGKVVDHLVETSYGFHIIKVEGHGDGKELSEVKEEIRAQMEEQKKQDAFPPVINKLMEKYELKVLI